MKEKASLRRVRRRLNFSMLDVIVIPETTNYVWVAMAFPELSSYSLRSVYLKYTYLPSQAQTPHRCAPHIVTDQPPEKAGRRIGSADLGQTLRSGSSGATSTILSFLKPVAVPVRGFESS